MDRAALRLARRGFDVPRLTFGLRTALASCLALLFAWLLGLDHPQWSAMTVWAASQPVRGMLIEKSFFRALGTAVGTAFGALLVVAAGDHHLLLVIGLVLWIGLCAGAGNVLHGLVSYGTLLAGYSASLVALLSSPDPANILPLAIDRLATVLLGVLLALIVGLLFTSGQAEDDLADRVRRLSAQVLHHLAAQLGHVAAADRQEASALLSEVAAIENAMETHAAGSLRSRHSARSLRAVLSAQVAAILWLKGSATGRQDRALARHLDGAALMLDASASLDMALAPLRKALAHCAPASGPGDAAGLQRVIARIVDALEQRNRYRATGATDAVALRRHIILHRDWADAWRAMARATGMLLLVGLVWVATGWEQGAYVLLGTSVMVTLFSTFENPAWIMFRVFVWQAVGAAAALACRWLVWPHATSELALIVMLVPFILVSIFPFAHRRTMTGSVDYVMVLLLLSQPALPLGGSVATSLATAVAVVAGPLLAFIAFKLVFPTDAGRRRQTLMAMMIGELEEMAADPQAPLKRRVWEARLHHRVMRLVHWTDTIGEPTRAASEASLAVLGLGGAVVAIRELLQNASLPDALRRPAQTALVRIRRIGSRPDKAAGALATLCRRVQPFDSRLAEQLADAGNGLLGSGDALFKARAQG